MGNCFSSASKFLHIFCLFYVIHVLMKVWSCIILVVLVNMSAGFRIGNYCFSAGRVRSFSQVCQRLMSVEGQTYMCVGNGTEIH